MCFYFHPNSKVSDVHKVEYDLHSDDNKLIFQTIIPQRESRDRIAWTRSSKGVYTIKTGYRFWTNQNNEYVNMNSSQSRNGANCGICRFRIRLESFCGDFVRIISQ